MRFLWLLTFVARVALAAGGGIQLDQSTIKTFTCSSGGSAAQTIAAGEYLVTVTAKDSYLCFADSSSTCSSGGSVLPMGTSIKLSIGAGGQSVSCRSSDSSGVVQFTKGN